MYDSIYIPLRLNPVAKVNGQFKATSPKITPNGGSYREEYQNGFKLGIEIVLEYPEIRACKDAAGVLPRCAQKIRQCL